MPSILPLEARWVVENRWNVRVLPESAGGCHWWLGRRDPDGYGSVTCHGRPTPAHRVALVAWLGRDLGEDMTVGHMCHEAALARGTCSGGRGCAHRRCVNPMHLMEQTRARNASAVFRGR